MILNYVAQHSLGLPRTDRRKDVIKTGGESVASIEVEKALYAADQNIAEAAAIGLPHERWTEAITAIIVPAQGCGHTIRPPGSKIPQKEEAGAAVDP